MLQAEEEKKGALILQPSSLVFGREKLSPKYGRTTGPGEKEKGKGTVLSFLMLPCNKVPFCRV